MIEKEQQDHDRSALILFGTETGTAQDFAEEISRATERLHFRTDVAGLDDVDYTHLHSYTLTIFVIATTGQGDFPDNARKFWTRLLRRKLLPNTLTGVNYALLGLCDSSYTKFNWAARKLDKRLQQLGAFPLLQACEADEQGDEGTDGSVLAWLPLLKEAILTKYPLPGDLQPISNDAVLPSKYRLQVVSPTSLIDEHTDIENVESPISESTLFKVRLEVNERVTPINHWQDVRFLSLTMPSKINYMPGDALAISPRNLPEDVSSLLKLMRWEEIADNPIALLPTRPIQHDRPSFSKGNPIASRKDLTLRILFTEYLDINAIPRRSFFAAIANYTSDEMHKERLLEFTDPQYLDEYYDYATRPRRSIIEILQEFDTVQIPWQEITNIIPPLRPRQFSIASGGNLKHTNDGGTKFELLVAIVKYRTVIKRVREGVCTKYLAQLPVGTELEVSLKTEGRLASASDRDSYSNHILIGAGTGIAPLRALIHEKAQNGQVSGNNALFFGCRSRASDYFFQEEWSAFTNHSQDNQSQGQHASTFEVIPAFSRDQASKVYVQNRIRERASLIWTMLREQDATIILCGSSGQMPKAVRQALVDALVEQSGLKAKVKGNGDDEPTDKEQDEDEPITGQDDAERYLARLEKIGRFKQETWS